MSATGRFFYPQDWGTHGPAPCDATVADARESVRCILESILTGQSATADDLTRWIDKLIVAHVDHYGYLHPQSHHGSPLHD